MKNKSIRFLVLSTLATAFLMVLAFTLVFGIISQREKGENLARHQAEGLAKSYFDALNTMMLTGAMDNRGVLKSKVESSPEVIDIRIMRGNIVSKLFGPGLQGEIPQDDLDHRAFNGEEIELIHEGDDGRVLTMLQPILAQSNYQGTNCLGCHQAKENDILGVIRVDYSLAEIDSELNTSILTSVVIQSFLFLMAFIITAWVLNNVVVRRLRRLHDSMIVIAANSDLSIELEVLRDDEIGSVSRAFNRMILKINKSMCSIVDNAGDVQVAAKQIALMAETTEKEVAAQKMNTDQVAAATTEMAASAAGVKENADETAEQSQVTVGAAAAGEKRAQAAVKGIESLNSDVKIGAQRIEQLNVCIDEVATVLAVISSIADQTNLLALNAAIEAARAGEQGRGFAVVADEVRSLAVRTQESTTEIRQTIEGLHNEAAGCVEIMGGASELAQQQEDSILAVADDLKNIAESIRGISALNAQMSNAAHEQSQVSESISCNVVEISQSAEVTSVDAKKTANIAEDMLILANSLENTVKQFKLVR